MVNTPTAARLAKLPLLYQTENTPIGDTLIHLHFFIGSCDWFIAEYDGDDLFSVLPSSAVIGRTQNGDTSLSGN